MSHLATTNPRVKALDNFAARCAAAGVFSWSVRDGRAAFNDHGHPRPVTAFFKPAGVAALTQPIAPAEPAPLQLIAPGWHARLLPRPAHASRSAGTTLIAAVTPEFIDST